LSIGAVFSCQTAAVLRKQCIRELQYQQLMSGTHQYITLRALFHGFLFLRVPVGENRQKARDICPGSWGADVFRNGRDEQTLETPLCCTSLPGQRERAWRDFQCHGFPSTKDGCFSSLRVEGNSPNPCREIAYPYTQHKSRGPHRIIFYCGYTHVIKGNNYWRAIWTFPTKTKVSFVGAFVRYLNISRSKQSRFIGALRRKGSRGSEGDPQCLQHIFAGTGYHRSTDAW